MKKKLVLLFSVMLMLSALLVGCGKKSIDGYYTLESSNYNSVLKVDSDSFTYQVKNEYKDWSTYSGSIKENKDETWELYITSDDPDDNWAQCSPLIATVLDDGKLLYLDSDSSSWIPDSLKKVSKREYIKFIEEIDELDD